MGIMMCILHSCGITTCATVVHRAAAATNRYHLLQSASVTDIADIRTHLGNPYCRILVINISQIPCYKYSSIFSTWNKSLILVSSPRKTIPRLRSKYLILRSIVASSCDRAILPNLTRMVSRVTSSRSDCQYAKGSNILY